MRPHRCYAVIMMHVVPLFMHPILSATVLIPVHMRRIIHHLLRYFVVGKHNVLLYRFFFRWSKKSNRMLVLHLDSDSIRAL